MRIERHFTQAGEDAYASISFRETSSEIRNPDGSVVFRQDHIGVPEAWSQVASDILAQKYFRRAGVPARIDGARALKPLAEDHHAAISQAATDLIPAAIMPTLKAWKRPAPCRRLGTPSAR